MFFAECIKSLTLLLLLLAPLTSAAYSFIHRFFLSNIQNKTMKSSLTLHLFSTLNKSRQKKKICIISQVVYLFWLLFLIFWPKTTTCGHVRAVSHCPLDAVFHTFGRCWTPMFTQCQWQSLWQSGPKTAKFASWSMSFVRQ